MFGTNKECNRKRYRQLPLSYVLSIVRGWYFSFQHVEVIILFSLIVISTIVFILIEILNISEVIWSEDMIDIIIGSNRFLWWFVVILTVYENRQTIMSRSFKSYNFGLRFSASPLRNWNSVLITTVFIFPDDNSN